MALPNSVRTVIGARVGRLGQRAERILGVASVIGRDFDVPLLARASGTSEDDLLDILEAATAAALVREPSDASGRYIFAHALIQHSLYEDLGSSRRALAHRQIAQALEDLCGERPGNRIGELARHWVLASQPVDVSKAIIYCRQAGDEALGALAPADAMRWFTQALDLYRQASNPDPVLLIDLTIGLGNAQRQTGDPAYRDTLIEAGRRAVDVDDTDRLVAAVLANDRGIASNVGVYNAEKVTLFELALERLPKDRPERAQVLAALCGELSFAGSLERRLELGREALAIAEASGDDATVVRVVHNLVGPLGMPSTLSEFWARTRDALERAQHLGDPSLLFWAAARRAIVAVRLGHIDEFDRCVAISSEIAENLEQPFLRWVMLNFASMRAQLKGNIEGAERFANEALQMGSEAGVEDAIVFYGPQIFAVHQQRGSLAELIPLLEQLEADAADVVGLATSALEAAYVDAGRIDDVRDLLDRIAAADFEVAVDSLWLNVMVNYAGGAIAVREPRYAEALLERMAPWANQWVTAGIVGSSGPVCCFLGGLASVLGRFNEGNALFVQSAAICSEMGAKYWAARTNLMWGTMLAERNAPGDAEKAHDVLTRAHTVAATNGYGSVERLSAEALELLNH
jgi:tetratricopeptide (TPR) repeat protein